MDDIIGSVIFLNARPVNPRGQLVNSNEDTEESEDLIEPPMLPEVLLKQEVDQPGELPL